MELSKDIKERREYYIDDNLDAGYPNRMIYGAMGYLADLMLFIAERQRQQQEQFMKRIIAAIEKKR